jgi:hypothetical protein
VEEICCDVGEGGQNQFCKQTYRGQHCEMTYIPGIGVGKGENVGRGKEGGFVVS